MADTTPATYSPNRVRPRKPNQPTSRSGTNAPISKAYTGKTCRVARTEWTQHFDEHPEELQGFPAQAIATIQAGIDHLGVGPDVILDTNKAFMAIGQAVGAIDEIKPARQVVTEIMDEARRTLERLADLK